jgi:nitrite reductase/ring-hydroxylating ferredoxin subunit
VAQTGESAGKVRLCSQAEVAPGSVKRVVLEGRAPLAVYNLDGEFFVTDDTCTHGQASLAEGVIEGDVIECPLHGGCFDIRTGEPVSFPVVVPIRTYPVTIIDGDVYIELN